MITSIEIAKILRDQNKQKSKSTKGFDAALFGLGIRAKAKTKKK